MNEKNGSEELQGLGEANIEFDEKGGLLLDSIPDNVVIVNQAGDIQFVNRPPPGVKSKVDVVGESILKYILPDYHDEVREAIQRVFHTGEPDFLEIKGPGFTESPAWYEVHLGAMIRNAQVVAVVMIARDATQRRAVEDNLKRSEIRYRHLANSLSDIFFAVDRDLKCTFWNKASETLTGIPSESAIGKSLEDLLPMGGTESSSIYVEVLKTGKSQIFEQEYSIGDKSYFFEVSVYPSVDGISVFAKDCSERKKIQHELKRHQDKLEVMVKERTARLKAINKALELQIARRKRVEEHLRSSRSSLRALLGSVESVREQERIAIARELHDELGAMLTALKMNVNLMCGQSITTRDESLNLQKTLNQQIDKAIDEIRKISKELRPLILDELGLAAAIEWQAKEFVKRSGIPCIVKILPEDLWVDSKYATVFFRIFQELLTNISRHAEATKVEVYLEKKPGKISLIIKDNGIGITKREISDPNSIGLLGVRERVHALRGEVFIQGKKNKGTCVEVNIPFEESPNLGGEKNDQGSSGR